jgi:nucleotide-binding universal stress UspA family protein
VVPVQSAVVALAGDPSDENVLKYADLLSRLGIIQSLRFAYVSREDVDTKAIDGELRRLIAQHFPAKADAVPLEILVGDVLDQLIRLTTVLRTGLLLVGSRFNRNGRPRLAQRLAMAAPCAVWMVPETNPPQITHVLAPVDYSQHSATGLAEAAKIAQLATAKCLAMHVFFDEAAFQFSEFTESHRNQQLAVLRTFVEQHSQKGPQAVGLHLEDGVHVGPAVLRTAAAQKCDLIVISTRGRSCAAAILLGSEASQIMDQSPIPVLAIKPQGAHLNLLQAILSRETWHQSSTRTN